MCNRMGRRGEPSTTTAEILTLHPFASKLVMFHVLCFVVVALQALS